jgi:hypothetical protein
MILTELPARSTHRLVKPILWPSGVSRVSMRKRGLTARRTCWSSAALQAINVSNFVNIVRRSGASPYQIQ